MTCGHYKQFNRGGTWKCRACGEEIPHVKRSDEELVAAVRGAAVHVVDGGVPDLGGHVLRHESRTGTAAQEERAEANHAATLRDMERNGAKKREVDGARHTHSIPVDAYFGAQRKYGKDVWKDKKFVKRWDAFKTTND